MPSVDWYGTEFELSETVNDFVLDEYLSALADANPVEVRQARIGLLKEIIGRKQWSRFRALAVKHDADADAMFDVINRSFEARTGRPTERPSDSSSGPRSTSDGSTDASSSRVIAREEAKGRPDRALMVLQASGRATG